MAKFFESITDPIEAFIQQQQLFFVATAPLDGAGHVNLSPKGLDSFRIISPNKVAYLDMTGSGNETSAHILENGRITFMFCGFEGAPNIVRLFGKGYTVSPDTAAWDELSPLFTLSLSARQIIVADIYQTQTSCGFGVPLYEYVGQRDTIDKWAQAKGEQGIADYRAENNMSSLDGLPTALASQ